MFLVELIWSIFISLVSNLDPDIQTMDEAYWSEATEWSQSLGSLVSAAADARVQRFSI